MAVGFFLLLANPSVNGGTATAGVHTDLYFGYYKLAPQSIAGGLLMLAGTCGLIYRFVRKTPKN